MKTIDLESILRSAGGDGASTPAPARVRTRIFKRETFVMEPTDQGDEHEVDVVVCTEARWRWMSSRKRYRADQFSVVTAGPVVVAVRVSR